MTFKRRAFAMRMANQTSIETIGRILSDTTIDDKAQIRQIRSVIQGLRFQLEERMKRENAYEQQTV